MVIIFFTRNGWRTRIFTLVSSVNLGFRVVSIETVTVDETGQTDSRGIFSNFTDIVIKVKTTLETSGEDIKLHSKRVEKM